MTEEEWLGCEDPEPMEKIAREKGSDRKLRLYAVACCRRIWRLMSEETSRQAVEVAERLAEGLATSSERRAAYLAAQSNGCPGGTAATFAVAVAAYDAAVKAADHAAIAVGRTEAPNAIYDPSLTTAWEQAHNEEQMAQVVLLRDIFGNPFRPVSFSSSWRTDTTVALARQMYESREFGAMPILADALQDAGCDNNDILAHCRGPGPHVRGCWVGDLVLGKE